ncbi:MAG: GNAT family N-acetyltransferase, partial [Gammaproteobacteria bacterium]|nr:GNAT family N-acetyltransferase [Gammaproteobacteria bacterium]
IRINLCSQVANERLLRQGGWQLAGLADPLNAKAGSLQMLKVMDMLPWPCRVYDQICDGLVLGLTDPKTTLFQFYPIEVLEGGYQLRSPLRVRAKKNSAISLFHDRRLIWRGALDHAFEHTIFEGQRAILTSVIPKAFCDAGAAVRTYCEPVKRWSQLCKLTWLNDVRVGFSEPGDIAALSLCVACYLKKDFLAKAKPQEHFYRHLASIETSFNNAQGMVLYDGDTLLGFLTWRLFDGLICHIDVVEVASAYQNQGVLSHMLNLLKKHFPSIAFFEFMPNDATIEAYRASNAWERVSSPGGVVFVNFSAHQADDCSSAPMALEARLCISPAPAFGRGLFYRNSAVKQYPIIVEKGGYLTTPLLLKLMPNTRVSLCLGPKTFVVEKAQELLAHGDYSVGRSGWMVIKAIRGGDKREINADVQNWIKAAMTGKKPPKPSMIAAIARLGIARANLARRTVDEAYEGGAPGPSNRRPRL